MKRLLFVFAIASIFISCKIKNTLPPETKLSSTWDGSYTELASSGGVYRIYYASQLAWIAKNANEGNGFTNETIILMNDINLSGRKFSGIATVEGSKFMGIFDGNGHLIEGLKIESLDNNVGFIGYLDVKGIVKNLDVSGSIEVKEAQGIVRVGGIVGINYGQILNVTNNSTIDVKVLEDYSGLATAYVGGVAGVNNSLISESANTVDIKGLVSGFKSEGSLGGIVGLMGIKASVSKCYNSGNISSVETGSAIEYVGGLVGNIFSNPQTTPDDVISISNSYNVGNITNGHASGVAGGIFGNNASGNVEIENCYNIGRVDTSIASGKSGGLVGYGGNTTKITSSYNSGIVTGHKIESVGDSIKAADIKYVYYLSSSGTAGALDEDKFTNGASFDGFSFGDIWTMSKEDTSATPKRRPTLIGVGYYLPPIIPPPPDIPR